MWTLQKFFNTMYILFTNTSNGVAFICLVFGIKQKTWIMTWTECVEKYSLLRVPSGGDLEEVQVQRISTRRQERQALQLKTVIMFYKKCPMLKKRHIQALRLWHWFWSNIPHLELYRFAWWQKNTIFFFTTFLHQCVLDIHVKFDRLNIYPAKHHNLRYDPNFILPVGNSLWSWQKFLLVWAWYVQKKVIQRYKKYILHLQSLCVTFSHKTVSAESTSSLPCCPCCPCCSTKLPAFVEQWRPQCHSRGSCRQHVGPSGSGGGVCSRSSRNCCRTVDTIKNQLLSNVLSS